MDMMLHHLARLEMMKAEEKGIDLSYEEALNIVNKQVMANELTFKIIDIENAIELYKLGLISEGDVIEKCKAILAE